MDIKEYQEKAKRTLVDLKDQFKNDTHMTDGMVTEIGELKDAYKKNYAYGKDLDMTNISEEVGDIFWYLVNFCTINNLDIGKILDVNIAKLEARFPDKFTQENAKNRDLNAERAILEKNNK